jgi:RNA polymerase sigma-70 factor (ECF subfamily)
MATLLFLEPVPKPEANPATGVAPDATTAPSFEEIFRGHVVAVTRWAARLGGPGVDCDEVAQEVFVVVQRRLPEFRGDGKLSTWLFRITAKVVANHKRASRRRRLWSRLTRADEDHLPGHGPLPGDALEQVEASRRFYEVLDRLAPRYREVLTLFELEELSTDAIAQLLDRPPATIRVWLHRGRQSFVKAWTRRLEEDEA